jgi:hypothetical protein
MLPFCFFSDPFNEFWALFNVNSISHVHWGTIPPLVSSFSICGLYSPSFTLCAKMVDRGLVTGLMESAAGEWMMIISLVFGGCCSYVQFTEWVED